MSDEAWEKMGTSYDAVADLYEERFLGELEAKGYDRRLLEGFAKASVGPIVELGCGPGQVGAFLRSFGRTVIGIDLSVAMATLAARRLSGAITANMRLLPLTAGSVGGIVAFYSVIHLRRHELEPAVAEMARVLRPEGRLVLSAHEGDGEIALNEFMGQRVPFVATLYRLEELVAAAGACGLRLLRADRRPPHPSESPTERLYVEATTA